MALLSSKRNSISEWYILETFHTFTTEGKTGSAMASLQLSYDELLPSLKHCLLCFSIYPQDFEINADKLILWWIGEGLVQGKDSKTALELISRCLVEIVQCQGFDGRVYTLKQHPSITNLKMLIILDLDKCPIKYLPWGLRRLSYLQELYGFVVSHLRGLPGQQVDPSRQRLALRGG
ncbi:unnamed protein product [Prunus armeniaca]|uniref:Disease resistance protein winged helix domain-containing protein n=1 Tax=Prunus armeniaca TaxID=36596 RepID=A0A6J5WRT3_PRUAR|nr:unnamed protein product [Prunus armeniaca]